MIYIQHINIQGLSKNDTQKNSITDHLTEKINEKNPIDFLLLSETHSCKKNEVPNFIKFNKNPEISEQYRAITCHTQKRDDTYARSKGAAIIYRKLWQRYQQKTFEFPGRFKALLFSHNQKHFFIGCAYIPTNDGKNREEYNNVKEYIYTTISNLPQDTQIVMGGDWNAVLNPNFDRNNKSKATTPENDLMKRLEY